MVAASAMTLLSLGVANACHPQGVIEKTVQDVTTGSSIVDADTAAKALNVQTGDTLVYYITVTNQATADNDQMINTLITDQLPAGVQLIKEDDFNVGTVAQGKGVTRTVTVKVTATAAGAIKNQACFSGDSIDHKQPQKGCEVAYVNVVVPTPTPTPMPTPTPTPVPTPVPSPVLPDTGSALGSTTLGLGSMITAGVAYLKTRKTK